MLRFAILRYDWATPDAEIISAPNHVGPTLDGPATTVGGKERLKLSPAEVAAALTEHIFGDEEGEERDEFLACVAKMARAYGVRGSTVTGTASADVLVDQLFSSFDAGDITLSLHKESCSDRLQSVR